MGWLDRVTGHNSTLEEYEPWVFVPAKDITAYELALLITKTETAEGPVFPDMLYLRKGETVAGTFGEGLARHFSQPEISGAPPC